MNLERKEAELVLNALDVFVRQGGIQVAGDAYQVGLKVQDYLMGLNDEQGLPGVEGQEGESTSD